jgi:hypothetical protein
MPEFEGSLITRNGRRDAGVPSKASKGSAKLFNAKNSQAGKMREPILI